MDRKAYLWALEQALTGLVPARERAEMLRYYEEYFDEAGPEGEAGVIESLGDPRELAKKLAMEAGFSGEAPVRKKRRVWPWVLLGIAVVLVVIGLLVGLLLLNLTYVPGVGGHKTPVSSQTVEMLAPDQIESATEEAPLVVESQGQKAVYGREFRTVDVEVPLADVSVIVGENYGVELRWDKNSKYSLKCAVIGGELKVTASHKALGSLTVDGASVVITIPAGAKLNGIDVETGLGAIRLAEIAVREADCGTGLGDVTLEQVDGGEITAETGMGNVSWNGPLTADIELTTGMGNIEITTDSTDGWDMELTTGMGQVTVNGEEQGNTFRQWGSVGEVEAATGMGDITLSFGK